MAILNKPIKNYPDGDVCMYGCSIPYSPTISLETAIFISKDIVINGNPMVYVLQASPDGSRDAKIYLGGIMASDDSDLYSTHHVALNFELREGVPIEILNNASISRGIVIIYYKITYSRGISLDTFFTNPGDNKLVLIQNNPSSRSRKVIFLGDINAWDIFINGFANFLRPRGIADEPPTDETPITGTGTTSTSISWELARDSYVARSNSYSNHIRGING